MDKKQVIDYVHTLVGILKAQGISINKALLYGSYAYGNPSDESDIDVALISDLFEGNYDELAGNIWVTSKKVNIRIEPYLVSKNKFNTDNVSPIINIIKTKGIEVV
jgi:predicted nucleotidyltransferase